MFFTTKQHQCNIYEFAERSVKRYSGNKTKTEFYSQLFIVSTDEVETMSNSVRKFNKLHKFMNFSWENFRWLRHTHAWEGTCSILGGYTSCLGGTSCDLGAWSRNAPRGAWPDYNHTLLVKPENKCCGACTHMPLGLVCLFCFFLHL